MGRGWMIVAGLIAAVLLAGCAKTYRVPSGSMIPTLKLGSSVTTGSVGTLKVGQIVVFHPPTSAFDIDDFCSAPDQGFDGEALITDPAPCDAPGAHEDTAELFIKRVVGLPGDTLRIVGGDVYRDGRREPAPYITACDASSSCSFRKAITVPAGDYYVLGDNRGDSLDSRYFGPIPRAWITGVVTDCSSQSIYCVAG